MMFYSGFADYRRRTDTADVALFLPTLTDMARGTDPNLRLLSAGGTRLSCGLSFPPWLYKTAR